MVLLVCTSGTPPTPGTNRHVELLPSEPGGAFALGLPLLNVALPDLLIGAELAGDESWVLAGLRILHLWLHFILVQNQRLLNHLNRGKMLSFL